VRRDITSFNQETKRAATVPQGALFTNAVKSSDGLASASVNTNTFCKALGQAVIQQEAQYDYITRAINENWCRMYKDVLNDLRESAFVISTDV
jgi:hypothetical protein